MGFIGARLKAERDRLGFSQEKFSELCGVKKGAQINYEQNKRKPDVDYLANAHATGVDVQFVITGKRSYVHNENVISEIVQTLEELLDEYEIDLPAASKGRIVEALFDHCITNKQKPSKSTIVPFLKAAGF